VDCYVINTGHLGERQKDIGVEESVTILREIARGTVEWTDDEATGLTVPSEVPGLNVEEFAVAENVSNLDRKLSTLQTERRTHLSTFEDLDDEIEDAVY
jgi:phosphoenolpyruvate carboxykinase (ATP)